MHIDFTLAVRHDGYRLAWDRDATTTTALSIQSAARPKHDTGLKYGQVANVTSVHGQLDKAALLHNITERCFVCF